MMEPVKARRYSWMDCPIRHYDIHGPDDVWRLFYKSGRPLPKPKKKEYAPIEKLLADKKWEEDKAEMSKQRDIDITANMWRQVRRQPMMVYSEANTACGTCILISFSSFCMS